MAERVIRRVGICHATNKISTEQMITAVTKEVGTTDIFRLGQHVIDTQDGIDNHHFHLLKVVLKKYFTLRQFHIAKLHTMNLQGKNVRHSLTKTILFKGQ